MSAISIITPNSYSCCLHVISFSSFYFHSICIFESKLYFLYTEYINFFLFQPDSLCLHNGLYNPLVYVTIDRDDFISVTLLFAFCISHTFCFIVIFLLSFTLICLCDILLKLFYYIFWVISFVVALILTIYSLTYKN